MKRTSIVLAAACTLLGVLSSEATAQVPPLPSPDYNVAVGAEVRLQGSFGNGNGEMAPPETIVDDQFLLAGTPWNQGTVWWDQRDGQPRFIFLTLPDSQQITSFTVQADNNDVYELSYWDKARGEWKVAWNVWKSSGAGMRTRPEAIHNRGRYVLPAPIWTTELRVRAIDGDGFNSVSEIRAFGNRA